MFRGRHERGLAIGGSYEYPRKRLRFHLKSADPGVGFAILCGYYGESTIYMYIHVHSKTVETLVGSRPPGSATVIDLTMESSA